MSALANSMSFAPAKTRRKIQTRGSPLAVLSDRVDPWRKTKPEEKKEIIRMKARNKIIGLGITMAALAISQQTSAQINPGPNNTVTGTYSSVAGGDWSQALGNYSTVAGGASNVITAPWAFIG